MGKVFAMKGPEKIANTALAMIIFALAIQIGILPELATYFAHLRLPVIVTEHAILLREVAFVTQIIILLELVTYFAVFNIVTMEWERAMRAATVIAINFIMEKRVVIFVYAMVLTERAMRAVNAPVITDGLGQIVIAILMLRVMETAGAKMMALAIAMHHIWWVNIVIYNAIL
jgi:hypothetical protein